VMVVDAGERIIDDPCDGIRILRADGSQGDVAAGDRA